MHHIWAFCGVSYLSFTRFVNILEFERSEFATSKGDAMLKTIMIGRSISVQGFLEKTLPDGRLIVRVGQRLFTGQPV
jgi:hypothetical protein